MSKRKRLQSIDKKLKEGRGQGAGVDYKPWLIIQDVSSLGRSTRLKGIKIPRQYEFLSDLERNYFYLVEYSEAVVDIREQYPLLPIEETQIIANELGIKHPTHPETGEPVVMSTDFLITVRNNTQHDYIARTVKYRDKLMEKRVLEKFEIERVYWERRDIEWGIVTELEISKTMAHNIAFVHSYVNLSVIEGFEEVTENELDDMSIYCLQALLNQEQTVNRIAKQLEKSFGLAAGCGLSIFKHLIITKVIEIELEEELNINKIQHIQAIRSDYSKKVRML